MAAAGSGSSSETGAGAIEPSSGVAAERFVAARASRYSRQVDVVIAVVEDQVTEAGAWFEVEVAQRRGRFEVGLNQQRPGAGLRSAAARR